LFDEIECVDERAHLDEPGGLELRDLGEA